MRIALSFEGESLEELRDVVSQLFAPLSYRGAAPAENVDLEVDAPREGGAGDVWWSDDDLRLLWRNCTFDAKRLWAEVAKRPDGYPFDALQIVSGWSGVEIGGFLSSLGHSRNKSFPGREVPLHRDYERRLYSMAPTHAAVIREVAAEQGINGCPPPTVEQTSLMEDE
jgi:hypothetical protein